ncbi:hypothetical protein PB1_05477 [Bacillus methanolicus PB1]|uniref:Uncharacterized protein n=1 Tax=Bacillus methanolicus PB1 TaxID=997296 RepID=I3DZW9_BACMT|nr:hypothetical protein PB1_05477 [Bacillus methanolicus PB1]
MFQGKRVYALHSEGSKKEKPLPFFVQVKMERGET